MNEDVLNYWGDRYTQLDDRYQLRYRHKLSFVQFMASLSINPQSYSFMLIYLGNAEFNQDELSLCDFLRCPNVHIEAHFKKLPALSLRYKPLLHLQKQAAQTFLFCAESLGDYWEQRLDRGQSEQHGDRLIAKTARCVDGLIKKHNFKRRGIWTWQQ